MCHLLHLFLRVAWIDHFRALGTVCIISRARGSRRCPFFPSSSLSLSTEASFALERRQMKDWREWVTRSAGDDDRSSPFLALPVVPRAPFYSISDFSPLFYEGASADQRVEFWLISTLLHLHCCFVSEVVNITRLWLASWTSEHLTVCSLIVYWSLTQPFLVSSRNAPPLEQGALRDGTKNGCVGY